MAPIDKLSQWLSDFGYTLKWGKVDECDNEDRNITINGNLTSIHKLFTLLHESGHAIMFDTAGYKKNFKSIDIAENKDKRHTKSLLYRYKKIKDEIDAWNEGYVLAKKLKIRINKKEYDKYAAKNVYTYIQALAEANPITTE